MDSASTMDLTSTIVIGVASGVISAAAVFLCVKLFNHLVLPWYQGVIYSGCDVSGTWHHIGFGAQEIQVELTQRAAVITGTAHFLRRADGNPLLKDVDIEQLRSFEVEGRIKDRLMFLVLRHTNPQRLGFNSYLLEVTGDGRRLTGAFSYYSVTASGIGITEQTLFRDRAAAVKASEKDLEAILGQKPDRPARKKRTDKDADKGSHGEPTKDGETPQAETEPAPANGR